MDAFNKLLETTYFGNILNLIGIGIALIGFTVTIVSALKSRAAALEAKEEALKVREDMRRIDSVSELSTAISTMTEIKRLHRDEKWIDLPERYSSLRVLLISIRSSNPNLSDKHRTALQSAITHFATLEHQVEESLYKNETQLDVPTLNKIVSKQIGSLQEILIEIRNNIGV